LLQIHGSKEAPHNTHHLNIYGSDQDSIQKLIIETPELGEKLHFRLPYTKAEIIWGIRKEMARTVDDILARRVRALFLDAKAAIEVAPLVASMLAKELGKDKLWQQQQIKEFTAIASHYIL
jgi:glycerol-3-phosphate dehydrogenase